MRRLVFITCLLLTLLAPAFSVAQVAASAQDSEKQRAQQLWEEAIAAKGGRERLRNVSSLFVKTELDGGDREYSLYVFPDYIFDYGYIAEK